MTDAFAGKGNGCHSSDSEFYMGCGTAGRCRHRPLRKRYKRCNGRATARVAPTDALLVVRRGGALPLPRATARVAPTKRFVGADDPVRSMWVCNIFVGQGPCALPWVRGKNPPVTASPCQPPLGKGAKEIRIATTSDIVHWFRNDRGFTRGAIKRVVREADPYARVFDRIS